jgi:hypothetical protein
VYESKLKLPTKSTRIDYRAGAVEKGEGKARTPGVPWEFISEHGVEDNAKLAHAAAERIR